MVCMVVLFGTKMQILLFDLDAIKHFVGNEANFINIRYYTFIFLIGFKNDLDISIL